MNKIFYVELNQKKLNPEIEKHLFSFQYNTKIVYQKFNLIVNETFNSSYNAIIKKINEKK